MDMLQPTDAHRKLEKLAGNWTGCEVLSPSPFDPTGGDATGTVHNRVALNGFVLVQDYEQQRDGKVSLTGHAVFTHDAGQDRYTLHWFDSSGFPPSQFHGNFEGDVLSMICDMPMGKLRATFDVSKEGTYVFKMEMSGDGQNWNPFMDGTYTQAS